MRRLPVRRGWALAAVAVLVLMGAGAVVSRTGTRRSTVGGRTAGGPASSSSATADAVAPAAGAVSGAVANGGGGGEKSQLAPAPGPVPVPPDPGSTAVVPGSPRIVRTADLRVKVPKGGFASAFDRVASVAAANGGFVSSSSTASAQSAHSGDLTVRVPSDRFDAVRQALGALGTVDSESIRGEDVSGQLVDNDARLKNLQAQEDSLRTLLSQAKAVGDVLSVQSSLFGVRQQIEQLQAQQANLAQSATLATIQVSLFEPGAPAVAQPVDDRSFSHSVSRAFDGMVSVAGGMIVVVGWLVPVAVLGLVVWGASRLLRRRPAQLPVT